MPGILARIEARRAATGLSESALSLRGGSRDLIRNWRRAVEGHATVNPRHDSLADIAAALGVSTEWLITGKDATTPPPARPGFADAATPFRLRSFAAPPDSAQPGLAAIFGPALATPASYQVTAALPGFGLLPGDVLVCDLARLPMPGELALVTTFDDTAAQATTTVCRYLPPWLVTGAPDAPPLRTDHPGVTVRCPVIGSIRGIAPT